MKDFLNEYMSMVKKIREFRRTDRPEWHDSLVYLQGLKDEIIEVQDEILDDNVIYLEDELSDILWDYMNFLYLLEDGGKIDSWKSVFKKSMSKYDERITDQLNGVTRKETKEMQKARLKKENAKRYE